MLRSVDAGMKLRPVLPELFAEFDTLGLPTHTLISLLRRARTSGQIRPLTPASRVLDLACGKGAMAIALARSFGCRATGVDGCDVFIEAAAEASAHAGVSHLCTWVLADVREWRPPADTYDIAMMIGLDGVAEAAPVLRRATRQGGVYVMDEAVRMARHVDAAEYPDVPLAREIGAFIEGLGDEVVVAKVLRPDEARANHRVTLERLSRAARRITRARPGLKEELTKFVKRHRDASVVLEGPLRPSWWIVRRH